MRQDYRLLCYKSSIEELAGPAIPKNVEAYFNQCAARNRWSKYTTQDSRVKIYLELANI